MKTRVQCLNAEFSPRLCELLRSEESAYLTPLWQDRRPNYFDLYRHFAPSPQEIYSYGISEGEAGVPSEVVGLRASSLLVGLEAASVSRGSHRWSLMYDTDCFITPTHRSQHLVLDLIRDRNALFQESRKNLFHPGTRLLFYGIENQPGFLKPIAANPTAYGGDFVYGPFTVLHDIYPRDEEVADGFAGGTGKAHSLERIPLHQITESVVEDLRGLEALEGERVLRLYPSTTLSYFQKLYGADPKGELWLVRHENALQGACTLINMSKVRKFRFTGSVVRSNSERHPLFRLGLQPGDSLRSLVVGRTWQKGVTGPAWDFMCLSLAQEVRKRQFHNFYIRDQDPSRLGGLFREAFHFKRRSLFWCLAPDEEDRALLQQLAQGPWAIHWDNHCL